MHSFTLICLLTGLIFILTAYILKKWPPRKINWYYGYRTWRSMKNQANWDEGNHHATVLLMRTGYLLLLSAIPGALIPEEKGIGVLVAVLWVIFMSARIIFLTERHLKKFNSGNS